MHSKWLVFLLLLIGPANLCAQETHLVAYAGFAGFQAPVWTPKDLGLFEKYRVSQEGLRNALDIAAQRNPAVKVDMNIGKYLDESVVDELEREGFFKRLSGKG
jgi:hypothetical protein